MRRKFESISVHRPGLTSFEVDPELCTHGIPGWSGPSEGRAPARTAVERRVRGGFSVAAVTCLPSIALVSNRRNDRCTGPIPLPTRRYS